MSSTEHPGPGGPAINGVEMPERIFLVDFGCGDVGWCDERLLRDEFDENTQAVEYVRVARASMEQSNA